MFFTIEIQKVSANENNYNVNTEEEYVDNEYVENLDGIIIDGESSQEITDEIVPPEKRMLYGISSFWEIYSKTKNANSYGLGMLGHQLKNQMHLGL
ncbi:hypothetical protein ACVEBN_002330 [Listeria monocytogenes]|nr:hypothetical protein [Listeria monocytogenes]